MKGEQSKLFKFNPIDTEQQKKLIAKTISPLQNLQEFLIQAQPFSFEAESSEFNDWFFNGEFKQNDILELYYISPYQKSSLLNYILVSFFMTEAFFDLEEKKNKFVPDLIYIDTSNNFNILSLHGLISENLFLRSSINPNFKNQNFVEEIISNIFAHLHVYKVYDLKQFMFTLRMLPFLLEKNKQIKLVIVDAFNSFPAYHYHGPHITTQPGQGKVSKDKGEMFTRNIDKKNAKHMIKLLEDVKNVREVGFIVTRKEMYKNNEIVGFNFNEKKLHLNSKILKISTNPTLKEVKNSILLLNFHSFDETSLNIIYNDMEILQKLDSFNSQNYSVADIIHNGNLCFAVQLQGKTAEMLCYIINKSNYFLLKSYPCIILHDM